MFYHGTTLENARHLLAGGEKNYSVWNCSYDDYLYVWSQDAIKQEHGLEDDGQAKDYAIRQAFESAQITAACAREQQSELIVLAFDFPEADVYDDVSCDHMSEARRVNSDLDALDLENSLIAVYWCHHNARLDPLILKDLYKSNNPYFNDDLIDPDLGEAIETISGSCFYIDSLFEYDWKEIGKEVVLKSVDVNHC